MVCRRRPAHRYFLASTAFASLAITHAFAQTHKVDAPQRVTRAVAVYEWTGDEDKPKTARLVPVSLFIDGRLRDAGVYLARPVPFALETGDLYAVEQAGENKGMFSVDHARNMAMKFGPSSDGGTAAWYGFGKFAPPKPPSKAPVLQASSHLSTINSSADSSNSSRPHFSSKSDTKPAASDSGTATKTAPSGKSASAPAATSDADRPQLKRPASSDADSAKDKDDTTTKSAATKDEDKDSKEGKDDVDRPTLRKRDPTEDAQRRKAAKESGVRPPEFSLNEDPDRPTMRRGAAPGVESTSELTGLPADMHQIAAVSDPSTRDPHVFAREWESPGERADTLLKLQALARPRVEAYIKTNLLVPGTPEIPPPPSSTPTPAAPGAVSSSPAEPGPPKLQRGVPQEYRNPSSAPKPTAPATKAATTKATPRGKVGAATKAKPAPMSMLSLTNEQLLPYTLSYGGLPTFVYTAQADVRTGGPVYVTVVAQRMVSGDMQVALSSVTDATHLDRTPWLRPVDAVDPDASHRASLLFELRAQSSRQFALYRLTSAQAEQIFLTGVL